MEHTVNIKDATIRYNVIHRKIKNPRLEFRDACFRLIVPEGYVDHEKLIRRHSRWVYNRHERIQRMLSVSRNIELHGMTEEELKESVRACVLSIGKELGVQPDSIHFRKMRTKWGSCSCRAKLNFNTHMRYLPEEMIEYIVYHEMVHLIEMNHGPRFWNYIRARFKDHKDHEEQLSGYWFLIQGKIK